MPPSTGSPAGTYRRARSEHLTTLATTSDDHQVAVVHAALARKGLLSREHLVDGEYTDSNMLVTSPQHLNKRTKKNAVWTLAHQHTIRQRQYRSPAGRCKQKANDLGAFRTTQSGLVRRDQHRVAHAALPIAEAHIQRAFVLSLPRPGSCGFEWGPERVAEVTPL